MNALECKAEEFGFSFKNSRNPLKVSHVLLSGGGNLQSGSCQNIEMSIS